MTKTISLEENSYLVVCDKFQDLDKSNFNCNDWGFHIACS